MKIKRIKIIKAENRPLLNGLELYFDEAEENIVNANCFIGVNGSGKSQLLESIAEIFLYLDKLYRHENRAIVSNSPLLFEIVYTIKIDNKKYQVEFIQHKPKGKEPLVTVKQEDTELDLLFDDIDKYLPEKIVGYTSGENETLSIPFFSYFDEYAEYTGKRAFEKNDNRDYEPRFYFMDYSTNLGIILSNLVFETESGINLIKKELQLESIKSFQIIIQTDQSAAPKLPGTKGILLTKELNLWKEQLINSATCVDYDNNDNKYTLDFYVNDSTKEALIYFFKTAHNLYTALYKFELLNNLIIERKTRKNIERKRLQRKFTAKMPSVPDKDKVLHYSELKLKLLNKQVIDYISLSDGEHQYFNVFGTFLMINHANSLFLLDEPETHFNPIWRRHFISTLKAVTMKRTQDVFITSHSPFIVSDTKSEDVFIFERINKDEIAVNKPRQETYGASFNNILKMAFGLNDTVSNEALMKIEKLMKETDIDKLNDGIEELGDSPHLMSLYRRMQTLKENKDAL